MKRFWIFLIGLVAFCTQGIAADADVEAVSMMSYEQEWLDHEATIALRNNTDQAIHNVTFVLDYLDMNGVPMDYKTYSYSIDIAPGKTKKLDIPAYEADRHYEYYKSKNGYSDHIKFKVQFTLSEYNSETLSAADVSSEESMGDFIVYLLMIVLGVCCLLGVFGLVIWLYAIVGRMAKNRNRDSTIWVLLALVFTPITIMLVLYIVGPKKLDGYGPMPPGL